MTRVRDAMTTEPRSVVSDAPVADALDLMKSLHIRHVPVVDAGGRLVGLITERDALGGALGPLSLLADHEQREALQEMKARELMTPEPTTTSPDVTLAEAARVLLEHGWGCLPVVEDGTLVGILTESDFVREIAKR